MREVKRWVSILSASLTILLTASAGLAQNSTGIAGIVRDTSGSVVPGVTVEASSPALIEKVRTAVTDEQGQYKIVALLPGVYTVTFTLAGFSTFKRDGIELTADFTATVNAELRVGALEETITVSGQSPVVDVQNVATRNLISRDALDTVPTNKTLEAYAALTPGVTMATGNGQDVGGSKGETYVQLQIHGSRTGDAKTLVDGFETNEWSGRVFVPNPTAAQEVSLDLGNGLGESPANGVYVNYIPKSGSNVFSGSFIANYTGSGMQSAANLTADLQSRGLTQAALPQITKVWDVNGSIGGPIVTSRLWFFEAARSWGSNGTVVGTYYTATVGKPFQFVNGTVVGNLANGNPFLYARDTSRPAFNDFNQWQTTTHATWQASNRNKIDISYDWEYRCDCHRSVAPTLPPEASAIRTYHPKVPAVTWTFPATNRLLFSAGTATVLMDYGPFPQPETPLNTIPVLEQNGGVQFLATPGDITGSGGYGDKYNFIQNSRFSASYVTGSHAFKVGMQLRQGVKKYDEVGSPIDYRVMNGVPNQVTLFAYPLLFHENMRALMGIYGQDQWTLKRLTVSGGLRFDYENAYVPAQHLAAGAFIGARDYGEVDCVPCWKDLSPRMSAAYDLFGTGKTAIKVSVGRYVTEEMLATAHANNPLLASNASASRSWNDSTYAVGDPRRGNYVPDCDFSNPLANGECGPLPSNFGQTIITSHYAPDVLTSNRPYNWATSVAFQHELRQGMALGLGYYRTSWHNFTVTDNQLVTPSDYTPFCITVPVDPQLPNGGGNQLCGFYNINPNKFSSSTGNTLVTEAGNYGTQTDVYNGIDLTVNARFGHGGFLQGGLNAGRTETNTCAIVVNRPDVVVNSSITGNSAPTASSEYCDVKPPFWRPQIKLSGSYPLAYGFQVSGVFQSLPGIPIAASAVILNAAIRPSLGRDLSGGVANVTVSSIIPPMTMFEARLNQLDVRFIRNFRVSGARLQGTFDIYNAFNSAAILSEVTQYGPTWRNPASLLDARILKVGIQMNF